MPKSQTRTPAGRRGFGRSKNASNLAKYTPRSASLKADRANAWSPDWRNLPFPLDYYLRVLQHLSHVNRAGWAKTRCPFHEDRHASLSVRLSGNGAWRCFAGCGGGDLISFHMKRTGLGFSAALRDLTRR